MCCHSRSIGSLTFMIISLSRHTAAASWLACGHNLYYVQRQLGRLVHPGFITSAGVSRLDDIVRYLRAAARRLDRLPDATAADRDRMSTIHELEELHRARGGDPEIGWLLEELRVAQFAQGLGTREPVSAKRVRRLLNE